jgi:tetratricopeptide (TPR) repeat protein
MSGKKAEFDHKSRLHLNAAEGWLGLGNWKEAESELAGIAEALRNHPEVLQARYLVESEAKRWDACVEIGRALVELMPNDSFGWINRAYALRRATGGSVQAAYDALLPAAERLKDLEPVTFNLACYACQLGNLEEARKWLKKCFVQAARHGRGKRRRLEALAERDLERLWPEIKKAQEED